MGCRGHWCRPPTSSIYTDHGVVLPGGDRDADDFDCYTGSVIADGDRLHLFYTGHNPRRGPRGALQLVCHATSDGDPTRWTKHPEHTFGAPPGYLPRTGETRSCSGPPPIEPWQMVLAARHADAPDRRCGVVARLTSTDLEQWTIAEPLWEPHRFITQECPDVFQWGDWWYLVYSEFSDAFQTRYRIARQPDGPWLAPRRDTVDGRAFYAAKSVDHRGRRFFIGWIPTKQGESDAGAWQWAGDLAVWRRTRRMTAVSRSGSRRRFSRAYADRRPSRWRRSTVRQPSRAMERSIGTPPGSATALPERA